ncbi:hypothetical protein [Dolosigranulum savutiense]|uniref:Uncharacterized protein n=1 Tax=Dolosigranulum savutiense TaxID=3110288 RepID=A0AB74THU5_9LACT
MELMILITEPMTELTAQYQEPMVAPVTELMMILITELMTAPVTELMIQHQELMMELATQYQKL